MLEATIGSSPCFLKILHIARRSSISAEAITICQGTFIRTLPRSEMLYRANTRKARAGAVHLRGAAQWLKRRITQFRTSTTSSSASRILFILWTGGMGVVNHAARLRCRVRAAFRAAARRPALPLVCNAFVADWCRAAGPRRRALLRACSASARRDADRGLCCCKARKVARERLLETLRCGDLPLRKSRW